ncbi:hypothetical protein I5Q34_20765 [Streptomyces sp. AV19]|uniref:hypothetical protein n=1 Tax=Streptomyces sp. AV19 TaxID=2793068 RepID=UPI0018FEE341|nr:hypothetical protein [Streptomyces sp. AV19]MBH1936679.1 hypothetical protein [Streptomyces sp. AV19]MDG4532737.1 hypothetical protein [Streptomyces sp. AV19]
MQPPAGLPHTHSRPVHWLLTAVAVAAVLLGAALVDPGDDTATASAPTSAAPDPAAVRYPFDCGTAGVEVAHRAAADLDGDGRPETVAVVRCRSGAGTAPSGVYVLAPAAERGAMPRVTATLVDPAQRMSVTGFAVRGDVVSATLLGYSSANVPRCCPDRRRDVQWRWHDGKFALTAPPVAGRA